MDSSDETAVAIRSAEAPGVAAARAWLMPPSNLGEAMKVAELLAKSSFVPNAYKGKSGDVLCAIQYGAEIGLPPLQALQGVAVVNGRPSVYGDLGARRRAGLRAPSRTSRSASRARATRWPRYCRGKRTGRRDADRASLLRRGRQDGEALGQGRTVDDEPEAHAPDAGAELRAPRRVGRLLEGPLHSRGGAGHRGGARDAHHRLLSSPGRSSPRRRPAQSTLPTRSAASCSTACQDTGRTHADLKARLEADGIASTAQIPAAAFPALLAWAKDEPQDLPPAETEQEASA
jgi:hypothetical protein